MLIIIGSLLQMQELQALPIACIIFPLKCDVCLLAQAKNSFLNRLLPQELFNKNLPGFITSYPPPFILAF
jgi:hypothetical protein